MMNKNSKTVCAMTAVLALVSVLGSYEPCHGQTPADKIQELVNRYYEVGAFNGCILVAQDGEILYERAFGFADTGGEKELTLDHGFRLASVSKQLTAMAIMILEEQDQLSYEDTLAKFIPELPYRDVTVRQMLTHTSGLPDYSSLMEDSWDVENKDSPERRIASNADVLQMLIDQAPSMVFEPGTNYEYSNTAYLLLATVVERVTSMRFQDFMSENVFAPVGMSNTYVNEPTGVLPDANRAKGLAKDESGIVEHDDHFLNGVYGDGGIISTVRDMFKWDQALYTEKLVSKATLDEAFSHGKLNDGKRIDYGFGWSIIPTDGGVMVAHGGGWLGYRVFIVRDIPARNTVIQLCNMPGISRGELVFAINRILHGEEYELPKRSIADAMMNEIDRSGLASAIELYHQLKETSRDEYSFAESELNRLGYRLLQAERIDDAIQIFKLNVAAYPEAFNVYDSLGKAYMVKGDKELAIANYEKSIELNRGNRNARKKLVELRQRE